MRRFQEHMVVKLSIRFSTVGAASLARTKTWCLRKFPKIDNGLILLLVILTRKMEHLDSTLSAESSQEKFESAFPPSKILVPIDGSPMSKKAAEVAARIAKEYGAELIVLSVIPMPRFVGGLDVPRKTFDEYYDYMDQDARKSVGEMVAECKPAWC